MPIAEVTRVQKHLAAAEAMLAARATDDLEPMQRWTRRLLQEELASYRVRGCFPKNRKHVDGLTPHFIDADGTRCAMAHLMELGGAEGLAAEIAATNNNAYVAELAGDPRFLAWLDAAGLTVEEAATIQPGYSCRPPRDCLCLGNEVASVAWEGTIVDQDAGPWPAQARVDAVHGDTELVTVGAIVDLKLILGTGMRVLGTATPSPDGADATTTTPSVRFEAVALIEEGDVLGNVCLRSLHPMYGPAALGPITSRQAASLLSSPQDLCEAELAKLDPCWATDECGETTGPRCSDVRARAADAGAADAGAPPASASSETTSDSGCSTSAGAPVTSSAVLLAILGVLAARRRRR